MIIMLSFRLSCLVFIAIDDVSDNDGDPRDDDVDSHDSSAHPDGKTLVL